jgi:hypothetical protein
VRCAPPWIRIVRLHERRRCAVAARRASDRLTASAVGDAHASCDAAPSAPSRRLVGNGGGEFPGGGVEDLVRRPVHREGAELLDSGANLPPSRVGLHPQRGENFRERFLLDLGVICEYRSMASANSGGIGNDLAQKGQMGVVPHRGRT